MSIEDYSGVRSTIIDEGTPPLSGLVSRNSIFLFGVASSGPIGEPVWLGGRKPEDVFGPVTNDASFDMSLVRGFYEIEQSSKNTPDVALVRVGRTAPATIEMYENQAYQSGDLSYTLDTDGDLSPSITISAVSEGTEFNGSKVTVTGDSEADDGGLYPVYMRIELTDGSTVGFNLAKTIGAPGTYSNVSGLVNAINRNPNLAGKIQASFVPLETSVDITIDYEVTDPVPAGIKTEYDIASSGQANVSFGDKIVSIVSASVSRNVAMQMEAGTLTYELPVVPEKDLDGPATISEFIRTSNVENVLNVSAANAGITGIVRNLFCKGVSGWDNTYSIAGDAEHDWDFVFYVRRTGYTNLTVLGSDKYTLNASTGTITINETLKAGDVYFATYRYKVNYSEAKLRSDLVTGSDRSYFIFGDRIVFGAEQPAPMYVYYTANEYMDGGDVSIIDRPNGIIQFNNVSALPAIGETVTLVIKYEPELPAPSGAVLTSLNGSVVQPGSITGGKDGRMVSKADYTRALRLAMQSVDIYPRRSMVVMGMWMDETVDGYNAETGLKEKVPLNMVSEVIPYLERSSKYTNECELNLPVMPPLGLSQTQQNEWIDRLINSSATDFSRPANIIEGINNFRIQAPVGVLLGSHPAINNGRLYSYNPACVYAAFKAELPFNESAMKSFIPGNIQDVGVKIFNADTIGSINAKRYTAATVNIKGQYTWEDSPTLAIRNRSVYDRQFVRDTVYLAVNMAREACERYIGKPRQNAYLQAMRKDVGKALELLVPDVLTDIYVKVIPVADGYITGRTKLRMILETTKETRVIDIETVASLAAI